ncbi:hypothetical protein IU501_22995 [Nocardia otitidiscaviarum]|uniref:helix-turn-helix transcriptional regulator n=1 Tax=Nocardia otitidiscaviarum TaxID=1823 RepID=UPI0004A6B00F|nr:hypothetical protein [Nocardia otitidiscaviarum]MBF6135862.1 hypothetical protein [Nocardia otitidiscaviarum]
MVAEPQGITAPEIAAKYGRELSTVQRVWKVADWFPPAIGTRGKWSTYDEAAVDKAVQAHIGRPRPETAANEGSPDDLLTLKEVAAYTGLSPSTLRSDITRKRFPDADPDDADEGGVKRWPRRVADEAMRSRRAYKRKA